MSRILLQQGCRVVWLECDRHVPRCDSMTGPRPDPGLCSHCCSFNRNVDQAVGVERILLGDFSDVTGEERSQLMERLARDPPDDAALERVRPSFQRLLGQTWRPLERLEPNARRILVDLLVGDELFARAAGPLFDRVRPDAVLALNGKFYGEAVLLKEAAQRGIPTWTYERGNRRDTLVLSPRPVAIPFDTSHIVEELGDRPLTPGQRKKLAEYLDSRIEVGNGQVRFIQPGAHRVPSRWEQSTRRIALFTNLVWDSAVVGEDTVFRDMFHWISETIRIVAQHPDTQLVIRTHPAEEKVYWHKTRDTTAQALSSAFPKGLPDNVTLVGPLDPVDSYALVKGAHLVAVYASSIGMEAAAMGKRVVVAANSAFSDAPFVISPNSIEQYAREVAGAGASLPTADAVELAHRFLYRLYFEHMLPVPPVREDPTGFSVDGQDPGDAAALRERLEQLTQDARARRAERSRS